MQLGRVIGHATSTIKHPSLKGWRLVLAQMLDAAGAMEGDVVLAVDKLGCGMGQTVVLDSDGMGARELVGDPKSPVRWFVIGIADQAK